MVNFLWVTTDYFAFICPQKVIARIPKLFLYTTQQTFLSMYGISLDNRTINMAVRILLTVRFRRLRRDRPSRKRSFAYLFLHAHSSKSDRRILKETVHLPKRVILSEIAVL